MTPPNMLDAALAWAARGWRIFPVHTPTITGDHPKCSCSKPVCDQVGKHPRILGWERLASNSAAQVREWWTRWPNANIGGLPGSVNEVAFDLDKPHLMQAARELGLFSEPTKDVRTGDGTHKYFSHPPLPDGTMIHGIIARSMAGFVLLPPSLHRNGRRYELVDDTPPIPLPPRALAEIAKLHTTAGTTDKVKLTLMAESVSEGSRHDSIKMMAAKLAGTNMDDAAKLEFLRGFNVMKCSPPKPDEEVRKLLEWALTKERDAHAKLTASFLSLVKPEPPAPIATPRPVFVVPTDPLTAPLPGILEPLAQWAMDTAPYAVRPYAMCASLALGSVLCARRYATDALNYSSLYFLAVGKSGTGKEHIRKVVGRALRAMGADKMIGPNAFTSASAVFTSLLQSPQQISVMDEFGQFLRAASGFGESSGRKDEVLTTFMELYGRLDDFAQTPQYALLTASKAAQADAARKTIERPGFTYIGLTNPDTFYAAMEAARIASGWMNRHCVFELPKDTKRTRRQRMASAELPVAIERWGQQLLMQTLTGNLDTVNRLIDLPPPRVLTISEQAHRCFGSFEDYCTALADQLENERLGELPMRAAEQGMRLALIGTLADDPDATTVHSDWAEWGVGLSNALLERMVPSIREQMAENPLDKMRKRFVAELRKAGERGLTMRDLDRKLFSGLTERDRKEVVRWAKETGQCKEQTFHPGTAGGRIRHAFLAVEDPDAEAEVAAEVSSDETPVSSTIKTA